MRSAGIFATLLYSSVLTLTACSSGTPRPSVPHDSATGGTAVAGDSGAVEGLSGMGGMGGAQVGGGGSEVTPDAAVTPVSGGSVDGSVAGDAAVTSHDGAAPPTPPAMGAGKTILFVWGYGEHKIPGPKPGDPLMQLDATMKMRLESRGFKVELAIDELSKESDAAGKALLIISSSVNRTKLFDGGAPRFKSAPIPAFVMKDGVIEVMGIGMGPNGGFSTDVGFSQLTILAPGDPLAAGLTGDVTVYTKGDRIIWSNPAPSAHKIATVAGHANEVAIFAYPAGAMMAAGVMAPAKRMAFFIHRNTDYSGAGLKLFDAAVDFLLAP
jgi:hypothetical protein